MSASVCSTSMILISSALGGSVEKMSDFFASASLKVLSKDASMVYLVPELRSVRMNSCEAASRGTISDLVSQVDSPSARYWM